MVKTKSKTCRTQRQRNCLNARTGTNTNSINRDLPILKATDKKKLQENRGRKYSKNDEKKVIQLHLKGLFSREIAEKLNLGVGYVTIVTTDYWKKKMHAKND